MNTKTLFRALTFAAPKHRTQKRKDADASPYINHPVEVTKAGLWTHFRNSLGCRTSSRIDGLPTDRDSGLRRDWPR